MIDNPFLRRADEYARDLDIVENYILNMAQYISTSTAKPYDDVVTWLRTKVSPVDPKMKTLARLTGADRVKKGQMFSKYISEVEHTGRLIGPNLVVYENPQKKKAFLADFIDISLKTRKIMKKRSQAAEMAGDMDTFIFCDTQQGRIKIWINTISGAHGSPHNPLYNKSAHTTLTSVCRCATSYSNAVVEKLLMSNRHYTSPDVAISDMASIIRLADRNIIRQAMQQYGLVAPSKEYVINMVLRSCNLYWRSPNGTKRVTKYINSMNDEELTAVAYVSDLKAIKDNNDSFMRNFFTQLIEKPTVGVPNPEYYHESASDDLIAMVGLIMSEELNGRSVYDMIKEDPQHYQLYGATIKQIYETLNRHSLFIEAFFRTDCMPPNIFDISTTLRMTAIVSDTDSTIFTTEDWVKWYIGKNEFTRRSMSMAGAIAYIDSQVLAHHLAMLSKHLGVKDDNLFRLAMKCEFYQPVMGVTNMSKHYFSYILAREGNVFKKPKFDTKGVNLKNSKLPKIIMRQLNDYTKWVMDTIMKEIKPPLYEVLRVPATIAHDIVESLAIGKVKYLSAAEVKPSDAYKHGVNAPAYKQYTLWDAIFATTYGQADPPPYRAIKVPVNLDKRSKLEQWAKTLTPDMQEGLRNWLCSGYDKIKTDGVTYVHTGCKVLDARNLVGICGPRGRIYEYTGPAKEMDLSTTVFSKDLWTPCGSVREGFAVFLTPEGRLRDGNLPIEIARAVDVARIEDEMLAGYYTILECCGYYLKNSTRTRRLSKEIDISFYRELDEQEAKLKEQQCTIN